MSQVVFISYASQDKNIADLVSAKLEEKNIRAWIAPRDVPVGANFADSIISAINQCKILVLIWSQHSNTSDHVLNELNQAFEKGILIIPFRVGQVQPTNAMQYYIGRTQWLDALTPPLKKHIRVLVDTIQANLENSAAPLLPLAGQKTEGKQPAADAKKEREDRISPAEKNPVPVAKAPENESLHPAKAGTRPSHFPTDPAQPFVKKKGPGLVGGKRVLLVESLVVLLVAALTVVVFYFIKNFPKFTDLFGQSDLRRTEMAAMTPGLDQSATLTPLAATPIPTATAYDKVPPQISQVDGMPMVYVPAGDFSMGSASGEQDEKPLHTVYLDAYWIDQTEVTNAQYAQCVAEHGCTVPFKTTAGTRDFYFWNTAYADYPVVYVDWQQAQDYCRWAGRELPTEAQWEKAARGPGGYMYPWGNISPTTALANYDGSFLNDTTPVCSYPEGASPYGALDMAGNVWEWVADWYGAYPSGTVSNPTGPTSGEYRVLRGGAFYGSKFSIRSADRLKIHPNHSDLNIGFRCSLTQD